jgi:uridine kinase
MAQCTIETKKVTFRRGESLLTILARTRSDYRRFLLCKVNNRLFDLNTKPRPGDRILLLDIDKQEGYRCYQNSLSFLLSVVARELYPKRDLVIEHSFGDGLYCKFAHGKPAHKTAVSRIKGRMNRYIARQLPFERLRAKKESLAQLFTKEKQQKKVPLLKYQRGASMPIYRFAHHTDLSFTPLVPNTSYISLFDLRLHKPGFVLRFPRVYGQSKMPRFPNPRKLFQVFEEYEQWAEILGISDIISLNERIEQGEISDVIKIAEALHEKKIAQIADEVRRQSKRLKIILIAGPSASGKTTFSKRLAIQLRVNCLNPITISIDNYFKERDDTPRLPDGSYDFESIKAIDVGLLNYHLLRLLKGQRVRIPDFDFATGSRLRGDVLRMSRNQILIIEGIHGLNEQLTHEIPRDRKHKIYISALTQLNIDNEHRISTRDTRILRRMVRDSLFRGHSANETFRLWKNVERGEDVNIFPFQEEADVMFNSALIYEISVLKPFAGPLLQTVSQRMRNFSKSRRLLQMLSFFLETAPSEVPPTSILREFIGKSSFLY